ncbi:CPBP family intramembrane glutamic endopeptidase [Mucilaginibacter sp. McL0603]|uniref:CPBP family intramembrane glutamic endopeptidase n=1 Tax=Mucilaginibacter sp. McL0603 TaxID=3415670 RepID=UPI003CF93E9D
MNDLSINTGPDEPVLSHCIECGQSIATESRFCSHCGSAQTRDSSLSDERWIATKQIALFFIIDAVICCTASFIDFFKTLAWSVTFDSSLAISSLVFFFYNWQSTKTLLKWPGFSIVKLISFCVIAILGSITVSFLVRWVNRTLFSKTSSYYAFYAGHHYGKVLMVLFVAIMPALFEELGFRGFLLQKLLQVVDKKQAVFISGFLFAIMHTSFISLFWLIPFGLLLAYIRIKENTIWYGVFIHFCFNFTVCMSELYGLHHIYHY